MDRLAAKKMLRLTNKIVKAEERDEKQALAAEARQTGKGYFFETFDQAVDWLHATVDRWNNRPHSGLPKIVDADTGKYRHQSPLEAWQLALEAGWAPMMVSQAELDDAFRPHEWVKVRGGKVKLYGQIYHHADLKHHNDTEVQVAYDLEDGSQVWVKTREGQLIGVADFYEGRDFRPQSYIEMADAKRADAQQKRLNRKWDAVEATRTGRIIEGQKAAAELHAAAAAGVALLEAEMSAPPAAPAPVTPDEESNGQKFRRWLQYADRLDTLTEGERAWWDNWQTSSTWRALKKLYDDFGLTAIG
jgi:putative transposase